jgi:hypothetical protein
MTVFMPEREDTIKSRIDFVSELAGANGIALSRQTKLHIFKLKIRRKSGEFESNL